MKTICANQNTTLVKAHHHLTPKRLKFCLMQGVLGVGLLATACSSLSANTVFPRRRAEVTTALSPAGAIDAMARDVNH